MKQRILVAIIGVPALIGVLCFAPDWATAVLVAALCVIGCHEFMAAAAPEKAAHWWGLAATLAVFTVFTVYFSGGDFTGTAIHTIMVWLLAALVVVMFIAAVQAFGKDDELDFPDISGAAMMQRNFIFFPPRFLMSSMASHALPPVASIGSRQTIVLCSIGEGILQ